MSACGKLTGGSRIRPTPRLIHLAVPVIALMLSGCSTTQHPIANSLLDITGESRVTKLKSRTFLRPTLFEQHEAVSVNGFLQMPDVGQLFYFPGHGDPTSAIGIAVAQSYKLIGESDIPTTNDVENVRRNLDEVQFLTLRLAALDSDIKSLRTGLFQLATNKQDNASGSNLVASISAELTGLSGEQSTNRSRLLAAQTQLREALKPGIIIARWQAADSASASAKAGSIGSLSYDGGRARSGFVVLGGVRVLSVVYGEDFWWMLNNLRAHEKHYVPDFGVTTYLIQAKTVAYAAEMNLNRLIKVSGTIDAAHPAVPTSVEVEAALEQLAHFGNYGNLGTITWKREPYCFVCGIDLPNLATNDCDRVIQRFFGAQSHWPSPTNSLTKIPEPSYQGWRTVVAKVAHIGWFYVNCPPWGKRIWEKYKEQRPMHGAPTCPFCGGVTNAFVPGYKQPRSTNHCDYSAPPPTNGPAPPSQAGP